VDRIALLIQPMTGISHHPPTCGRCGGVPLMVESAGVGSG
jgi:hypothetical protein